MTHEVSSVYLRKIATNEVVDAELWDTINDTQLADWETEWVPELFKGLQRMKRAGVSIADWPQSRNWNWRNKTRYLQGLLGRQGFSIMCEGMTQGMMFIDMTRRAKLPSQAGQHLIYVDFLEAAPWNRPGLVADEARYRGVGSLLIRAAVALSQEEEFQGRIGLHSLPQANSFYASHCGMEDLGPDPDYDNLRYFEMTPIAAVAFLEVGGRR